MYFDIWIFKDYLHSALLWGLLFRWMDNNWRLQSHNEQLQRRYKVETVGKACTSVPSGDIFCPCSCWPQWLLSLTLLKTKDHFNVCEFYCWTLVFRIALRVETSTSLSLQECIHVHVCLCVCVYAHVCACVYTSA